MGSSTWFRKGILIAVSAAWVQLVTGCFDSPPEKITFAGRISQTDQKRWLNNRLVLVYAQGVEVGRAITQVDSFPTVVPTPTDGVYKITLDNTYGIKPDDLTNCAVKSTPFGEVDCWLNLNEDSSEADFQIPEKRLVYAIRLVPGDYDTLPEEIKEDGITSLVAGNVVVLPSRPPRPTWLDQMLGRRPSNPAPTPMINTPRIVTRVQYSPGEEKIDIPGRARAVDLNNCSGSAPLTQVITDSQTFVREFQVSGSLGTSFPVLAVETDLGLHAGYRQKQVSTETQQVPLQAGAHERAIYTFRCTEIWRKGVAFMTWKGKETKVPFRERTNTVSTEVRELGHCG